MSSATARKKQVARPARPAARYWKGKAPKGADALSSDSDEDEGQEEGDEVEEGDEPIEDVEDDDGLEVRERVAKGAGKINVALKDVSISREGKVLIAGKEEVAGTSRRASQVAELMSSR